jgi:hypothetical protein
VLSALYVCFCICLVPMLPTLCSITRKCLRLQVYIASACRTDRSRYCSVSLLRRLSPGSRICGTLLDLAPSLRILKCHSLRMTGRSRAVWGVSRMPLLRRSLRRLRRPVELDMHDSHYEVLARTLRMKETSVRARKRIRIMEKKFRRELTLKAASTISQAVV